MAARKKVAPKPADVVDAEFVETTPSRATVTPVKSRVAKSAKPVVEAEVVESEGSETSEESESEDVEPAVDEIQAVEAELEPEPQVNERKVKPSRGTGLAKADPLSSYMAEVTKHPL